ncbi:MAG: hypothetical protein IIA83_02965 [Thaumarchaeota archaeon]|nr:hypothetical protein [Nitrososphaerota archaeon]
MSGPAIFFLLFFGLLISFSIVFDFWGYLVMIAIIVFAGLVAWGYRDAQNENWQRRQSTIGNYGLNNRYSKRTTERSLRSKIDDEWNKQSSFGNAEDLR